MTRHPAIVEELVTRRAFAHRSVVPSSAVNLVSVPGGPSRWWSSCGSWWPTRRARGSGGLGRLEGLDSGRGLRAPLRLLTTEIGWELWWNARVDLWHVAIPLPAPFHPSWIPGMRQQENRFDLVRLTTTSGIEGWSAGPSMGREREGLGSLLGPYLLGERADDLASIRQRLREMGYLGWRCGSIEPACWDIVGKTRNKPVYELLGGSPGTIRLYASTGEVRSGASRVSEVEQRLAEGFGGVKLRVHAATLEEDLEQIRTVAAAIGERAVLGVDANQGWRVAVISDAPTWSYDRALRFCNEAAALGFSWVEEPLAMDDYEGLAALRAATEVTVAGGELNNRACPSSRSCCRRDASTDQPDAVMVGGIAESWAIAKLAERAGVHYTPHTWTNGIGFAINLALFAALPGRERELLEYPLESAGLGPCCPRWAAHRALEPRARHAAPPHQARAGLRNRQAGAVAPWAALLHGDGGPGGGARRARPRAVARASPRRAAPAATGRSEGRSRGEGRGSMDLRALFASLLG